MDYLRIELSTSRMSSERSPNELEVRSGHSRARTYDPRLVRAVLSQLSYASMG